MLCFRIIVPFCMLLWGSAVLAEEALQIWVSSDRDAVALGQVAARYQATTGVMVTVRAMDPLSERFGVAYNSGDGPDILLIGHDRMGDLARAGMIVPLNPPTDWADGILPVAMQAVQFDGSTWGYPVSVEALHLIYNRALVAAPITDFAEINNLPLERGTRRILWDYANPYFTMPLLMAQGGFAFEKIDGSYDATNTGINTAGAIAGAEQLHTLITEQFLPLDLTYRIMDDAMQAGRVAMVINGSWAWPNLTLSEIDFGVAPIPQVGGHPSPSYVTVQGLVINSASANRELARNFIESALTVDSGLAVWNQNGALGALADLSAAADQADPHVQDLLRIAATGVPLPNNPEMIRFWRVMRRAIADISSGAATPADALDAAASLIVQVEPPPDSG